MSWREVIETPTHYSHNPHKSVSEDTGNNGVKSLKSFSGSDSTATQTEKHNSDSNTQYSHNPQKEMPSREELARICRRATADYPGIEPERLRRFLETADDPEWTTERAARQLAKRMHEGLIRLEDEQ